MILSGFKSFKTFDGKIPTRFAKGGGRYGKGKQNHLCVPDALFNCISQQHLRQRGARWWRDGGEKQLYMYQSLLIVIAHGEKGC